MLPRFPRTFALLALGLLAGRVALPAAAATPPPGRNDYANFAFTQALSAGLKHFYARDFKAAQGDFDGALAAVGDNTLALSFLNASAAQAGTLDALTNNEEDAVSATPKDYGDHVRLAFSYMFQSVAGRDRTQDARDELTAAVNLNPDGPAAHIGLGILRFNERSANRAKTELLLALKTDPNNVLAREYLGQLYQTDLRDPQRGLSYVIDVPNLVPGYADIEFHIGSLLYDLKQPQAAINYVKRGIDLDTGHVGEAGQHGYTLLAQIYIQQHKLDDAKKVLNEAIAVNADTIFAKTLLSKIKAGDYDPKKDDKGAS
jgi:tetratricopeptide (TPR) repeat protein